jgi:hypothetical protein
MARFHATSSNDMVTWIAAATSARGVAIQEAVTMAQLTMLAESADGVMGGSALASWQPVVVLLSVVGAVVVLLWARGAPGEHDHPVARFLLRGPNALARVTGLPAWAAVSAVGVYGGLLVAGYGFYTDVAYHVAYGRDEILFTAPHTAIFVGLCMIFTAAVAGIATAHLSGAEVGTRRNGIQVPWSLVPLLILGSAAVLGFPVDELWHAQYGVDVTMWSPPHMLMIMGAALSGLAVWLVLAEAGVGARDSKRALAVHAITAALAIQGLMAPLGEFSFGVPQFQQLFHPVIVMIGGGALVAARLVLGRGWTLGIVAIMFGLSELDGLLLSGGGSAIGPVETVDPMIWVGSALVVELVALALGTQRALRFALAAGLGVGTVGLATEWWWNATFAWQPWTPALLPDAVVVGLPAAVASAVLAAGFGGALTWRRDLIPAPAVGAALAVVLVALAIPLPRTVSEASAEVTVEPAGDGMVGIEARLDPPDAAEGARWFTASAWQGGGNVVVDMEPVGDGHYVAAEPVPVDGGWKTLLRLHRGSDMMAVPIRMPADPEFGLEAIPAESRTSAFETETTYLLREATDGPPGLGIAVRLLYAALAAAWVAAMIVASRKVARLREPAGEDAAVTPARRGP